MTGDGARAPPAALPPAAAARPPSQAHRVVTRHKEVAIVGEGQRADGRLVRLNSGPWSRGAAACRQPAGRIAARSPRCPHCRLPRQQLRGSLPPALPRLDDRLELEAGAAPHGELARLGARQAAPAVGRPGGDVHAAARLAGCLDGGWARAQRRGRRRPRGLRAARAASSAGTRRCRGRRAAGGGRSGFSALRCPSTSLAHRARLPRVRAYLMWPATRPQPSTNGCSPAPRT